MKEHGGEIIQCFYRCLSVHGGGHAWQRGMHGGGACMAGDMHDREHTWLVGMHGRRRA